MRPLFASTLLLLLTGPLAAQEICNNGIDDDGDGLIDLNDNTCMVSGSWNAGAPSLIANGSFEDRVMSGGGGLCCPYSFVSVVSPNWVECSQGWHTPTQGTTDYMHACGFMPDQVVPQPLPDGEGCLGTIAMPDYYEYIGGLFAPALPADEEHVLTFWAASSSMATQGVSGTIYGAGTPYTGPWTITLFGHPDPLAFPIATSDLGCIGEEPGWIALGSVELAPQWLWQPMSLSFTAPEDIRTYILGAGCGLPESINVFEAPGIDNEGDTVVPSLNYTPYLLFDDLAIRPADAYIEGIVRSGRWCTNDLILTAHTEPGTTDGQWYHEGIALAGITAPELDLSGDGLDGGRYTYICTYNGEAIRSDIDVPYRPSFTATPETGYAPLEVTFLLTTPQNGPASWNIDGTLASGYSVTHVFEEPGEYTVTLEQEVDGCIVATTMTMVVQDPVGIAEQGMVMTVPIFPNPVNDLVHVESGRSVEQWRVMNTFGQVVLQGGRSNGPIEFATTSLSSGAYVLLMEGADARMMGRFIKR